MTNIVPTVGRIVWYKMPQWEPTRSTLGARMRRRKWIGIAR